MKPYYLQSQFPLKIKVKRDPRALVFGLGYPLLFHWISLGILLILAIFAAIRHSVPLMAFTLSILTLAAASWTWSRFSLQNLFLQVKLSRSRVFPDEPVTLSFELSNEKRLPLPWVQIEEALPPRLASGTLKSTACCSKERLRWTTAVSGRQRLKWRHDLICRARGEYSLGPLRIRSGDMFGLFPQERALPGSEELLVYPRILTDTGMHPAMAEFLGELEKESRLFEDPNRSIGPRDYRRDDPFKRIHWKATARQGHLQVRQFESSTGLNLLVMLDVQSFCEPVRQDEETFELAVSIAASLAHQLHKARRPVGLMADSVPEIEIPASSDRSQLRFILEALARIRQRSAGRLHALLEGNRFRFYPGTAFVIVTRGFSHSMDAMTRDIRRRGYPLFLVTFEDQPGESYPGGIPGFRVFRPGSPCSFGETAG